MMPMTNYTLRYRRKGGVQGLVDLLILLTANEIHPISALIIDNRPERGRGGGQNFSFSAFFSCFFWSGRIE